MFPKPGGGIKHWSIEMGSPSILQQSGWKFKDLKFGDKVISKHQSVTEWRPWWVIDPGHAARWSCSR